METPAEMELLAKFLKKEDLGIKNLTCNTDPTDAVLLSSQVLILIFLLLVASTHTVSSLHFSAFCKQTYIDFYVIVPSKTSKLFLDLILETICSLKDSFVTL